MLDAAPGVVVLKRCVDVDDLLASATSGQADVAVVGLDAHGLDSAAVDLLRRHQVRPVVVVPSGSSPDAAHARAARAGVRVLVPEQGLDTLADAVRAPEQPDTPPTRVPGADRADDRGDDVSPADLADLAGDPFAPAGAPGSQAPGRVVAVWGPAGAPGRTTVATGLAAVQAARSRPAAVVDADPWGGCVAQHLGVLDEVSGLLAAARLSTSGLLEERLGSAVRSLGPDLAVVTGLPRPDRWAEVREGTLEHLLEVLRRGRDVVVDTGPSLEADEVPDLSGRPGRNALTLAALAEADEVVVVGTPDPAGLTRLARGLVDVADVVGHERLHVVVNRMRGTVGWSAAEVEQMVRGFVTPASLHVLPEDQPHVDRALVTGRLLTETDGPLVRALGVLCDAVLGAAPEPAGGLRRRRAGRGRRR